MVRAMQQVCCTCVWVVWDLFLARCLCPGRTSEQFYLRRLFPQFTPQHSLSLSLSVSLFLSLSHTHRFSSHATRIHARGGGVNRGSEG